jgi:deoxycytidylate deaminase
MSERILTIAGTTRRFTEPPPNAVEEAVFTAKRSPCAKSKRGVAVYARSGSEVVGAGFNGPPLTTPCAGTDACRQSCSKVCVHAEIRALRQAHAVAHRSRHSMAYFDAVHVKVVDGALVAGGGPSCWQCSREVLDVGLGGFWLYQEPPAECPEPDCIGGPDCQTPTGPTWRYYTAAEFHAATLAACELPRMVAP